MEILKFCLVILPNGTTVHMDEYLTEYGMQPEFCGLSKVKKTKGVYAVYYDRIAELRNKGINMGVCSTAKYKGISDNMGVPPEPIQSKIPKGETPAFIIYFDQEKCLDSISS
jgi:hypothetical protein